MGLPALQIMKENKGENCYGKSPLLFLPLVFTLLLVCAAGCVNEGNSTEMSATTKTTTTTKSSSYGSYGSGGYNYIYTTRSTTKQYADDPYYAANDYNQDGKLTQDEFQGAVNDYMDDYFAKKDSGVGRYGYGSDYDNRVDEAANIFGEDPDHVNDVYEALGNAMW